jgi:AcrR family transcriptional regulator
MGKVAVMQVSGANAAGAPAKRASRMLRPQRRAQLLAAATKIVRQSGIEALTMAGLADEAGVSKPVVYEHFANSEDVALALLDQYFVQIVKCVEDRTQFAETLDEYIALAIDAEFDFHANGALSIRSITNGHTSSHATGDRLNAAFLRIREKANGTFQELLEQQGVPPDIAAVSGFVLSEMLNNTVPEYATRDENRLAREALKVMMLATIHAVCPDPKARPHTPEWILDEVHRASGKE